MNWMNWMFHPKFLPTFHGKHSALFPPQRLQLGLGTCIQTMETKRCRGMLSPSVPPARRHLFAASMPCTLWAISTTDWFLTWKTQQLKSCNFLKGPSLCRILSGSSLTLAFGKKITRTFLQFFVEKLPETSKTLAFFAKYPTNCSLEKSQFLTISNQVAGDANLWISVEFKGGWDVLENAHVIFSFLFKAPRNEFPSQPPIQVQVALLGVHAGLPARGGG